MITNKQRGKDHYDNRQNYKRPRSKNLKSPIITLKEEKRIRKLKTNPDISPVDVPTVDTPKNLTSSTPVSLHHLKEHPKPLSHLKKKRKKKSLKKVIV